MKYLKNIFVGVLMASVILFFTNITIVRAQASAGGTPFGGQRLFNITCTCSDTYLIYILDYASMSVKSLVYLPGYSRLYMNFNILGAQYLLGNHDPVGICLIYAGWSCASISNNGMINNRPGVGTS